MYSANGQFMGNVSTRSPEGLTFILPETYIEARNILGSHWSAWTGVRITSYNVCYTKLLRTGRIGVGLSPNGEGNQWKTLNLSGQGSLAGRMEHVITSYSIHYTKLYESNDFRSNQCNY